MKTIVLPCYILGIEWKRSCICLHCFQHPATSSSSSSSKWLLYSTSCAKLISSRAFNHHLSHSDAAGSVLSLMFRFGSPFWLCQSIRFFFLHTSFLLYKGIQKVLSSLVFTRQVLEGDQAMTIFSSLLYYSLHLSFHIILCSFLISTTSNRWLGEAASIENNQFYLQWFFVVVHNSLLCRKIL